MQAAEAQQGQAKLLRRFSRLSTRFGRLDSRLLEAEGLCLSGLGAFRFQRNDHFHVPKIGPTVSALQQKRSICTLL